MSAEMDYRLADDRPVSFLVTTGNGRQFRWTGTAQLINRSITVRSGPMVLLCDDNTVLNFAHVVSLEPTEDQPSAASVEGGHDSEGGQP